jgi:hypothetical protein
MDAPTLHWGERTELLGKRTAYVFSLDLKYALRISEVGLVRGGLLMPVRAQPSRGWATFHVHDEDLVNTVDGTVREVPKARVVTGRDRMFVDGNGVINLDGRLLLESDGAGSIGVEYGGVIQITGLRARLEALFEPPARTATRSTLRGTAYLATRYQSQHTKFRWLVQNQLIGFGTASLQPDGDDDQRWEVELSVDLYSAG